MAVHVRYKSLYISLPSSAKQQRDQIMCFLENVNQATNFSSFILELKALVAYLAEACFNTDRHTE